MNDVTNWESKDWFYLALACLAAFLVILPVEIYGVPFGADLPQHYQFALTFYDAIMQGDFFPSWMAKSNYGFGSIGIRFYPPLGYYVLALFRFLTGNWYEATWLAFSFWMMLGSAGVYLWAREFMPAKPALFAGVVYALMPNHLTAVYTYFLYGEFASAAILPFCFVFVTRICRDGRRRDVFYLAAAFSLLILSHLPSLIVGSLCLAVYALTILDWRKSLLPTLLKLSAGVLLGVTASTFYLARVVTEMAWVKHASDEFSTGKYGYETQFLPFVSHLEWATYIRRGLWYADAVALFTLLLLLPAIVFFVFDRIKRRENGFHTLKPLLGALAFGAFGIFMLTQFSALIWKNVSLFQKIQLPWRWVTVVTLAVTVALSLATTRIWNKGNFNRAIGYPLLGLFVCVMLFNITQIVAPTASAPFQREKFYSEIEPRLEGESYECWWAVWSNKAAFENKEKVSSSERKVEIQNWADEDRSFTIEAGAGDTARIATFYYPHWQAEINGQKVEISRAEDGTILLPIPTERAAVRLVFREPVKLQIAGIVSLLAWLLILAGFFPAFPFRK